MRRVRVGIALGGVVMLALTACGGAATAAQGTWESADDATSLTFTGEGLITGTDGCNTLSGTWEENGDDVTLSGLSTTEMHCPGVDVWLDSPASATVEGDVMYVFDAGGTELGELSRA